MKRRSYWTEDSVGAAFHVFRASKRRDRLLSKNLYLKAVALPDDPELDLLGIGDPDVSGEDDDALTWVAPTSAATLLLSTSKLHR